LRGYYLAARLALLSLLFLLAVPASATAQDEPAVEPPAQPRAQSNDENGERCKDDNSDPDLRIDACTEIIRSEPVNTKDQAAAFRNRAAGHFEKHEYDLAISDYDRAIELDPKDGRSFTNRCLAYIRMGQYDRLHDRTMYDRGIRDCDQAISLDPKNAAAFTNRGIAFSIKGQHDRAIQDFDQAISLDPKDAVTFYDRGNEYRNKDQYDRAIQDYDRAISLDPKFAYAFNSRGAAYFAKDQYDRAIQDFDQAISLDPKYGNAFRNLGAAYAAKGQYDRAIQNYDRAISLDRKDAPAFNNRGTAYAYAGKYDRAIQDYDRAISLGFTYAFNSRGRARFNMGQFNAAARDFEQSVAASHTQPYTVLWLHLARATDKQEDTEEFKRNVAMLDLKTWPGPVISFFLRQMSAQQVTEAAKTGDDKMQREQGCVASFYLGEEAVLRGSMDEAISLLRQARETCLPRFFESAAAAAELRRLGN
jgi:lipoprotein NlpI